MVALDPTAEWLCTTLLCKSGLPPVETEALPTNSGDTCCTNDALLCKTGVLRDIREFIAPWLRGTASKPSEADRRPIVSEPWACIDDRGCDDCCSGAKAIRGYTSAVLPASMGIAMLSEQNAEFSGMLEQCTETGSSTVGMSTSTEKSACSRKVPRFSGSRAVSWPSETSVLSRELNVEEDGCSETCLEVTVSELPQT